MDYLTKYHLISSVLICGSIKLMIDVFKNYIIKFVTVIITKTNNTDFIIILIKIIKILQTDHYRTFRYFICNNLFYSLYRDLKFAKRIFKPFKSFFKSKAYPFFINKIYKHSFIKRIKSGNITNVMLLYKPVYNKLNNSRYISKMFIRQSRFFTKTKFSSIRQECKNIVHLTLGLNTVFIMVILGVCLKWTFFVKTPILLLTVYILWASPILYRITTILEYYKNLILNKNN